MRTAPSSLLHGTTGPTVSTPSSGCALGIERRFGRGYTRQVNTGREGGGAGILFSLGKMSRRTGWYTTHSPWKQPGEGGGGGVLPPTSSSYAISGDSIFSH